MGKFDKSKLPSPEEYYSGELANIRARGGKYLQALCPFHDDKHRSFSVNLESGYFKCFRCDVSGSLVDFRMKRYGEDFKTAAIALGAWGRAEAG